MKCNHLSSRSLYVKIYYTTLLSRKLGKAYPTETTRGIYGSDYLQNLAKTLEPTHLLIRKCHAEKLVKDSGQDLF